MTRTRWVSRRRGHKPVTGLDARWYDRIRQGIADRRRGGRLPRTLRRLAAVSLIVAAGLIALTPPNTQAGEALVAAARDLPIGTRIEAADLQIVHRDDAPDGAIRSVPLGTARFGRPAEIRRTISMRSMWRRRPSNRVGSISCWRSTAKSRAWNHRCIIGLALVR